MHFQLSRWSSQKAGVRSEHINQPELRAVHLNLEFFLLVLRHHYMLVHSDHVATVSYINHLGSTILSSSFRLIWDHLRWAYPWLISLRVTNLLGLYHNSLLKQHALAHDWSHHLLYCTLFLLYHCFFPHFFTHCFFPKNSQGHKVLVSLGWIAGMFPLLRPLWTDLLSQQVTNIFDEAMKKIWSVKQSKVHSRLMSHFPGINSGSRMTLSRIKHLLKVNEWMNLSNLYW